MYLLGRERIRESRISGNSDIQIPPLLFSTPPRPIYPIGTSPASAALVRANGAGGGGGPPRLELAHAVVDVALEQLLGHALVLDHGELEAVRREGGVQVGVHGAPHPLDDEQIAAHRRRGQLLRHQPQVDARRARPVADHLCVCRVVTVSSQKGETESEMK